MDSQVQNLDALSEGLSDDLPQASASESIFVSPKPARKNVCSEVYSAVRSKATFWDFVWIFAIMSSVGLAFETIEHFMEFGSYQSRAGLILGPFSPVYGAGAVCLTIFSLYYVNRKPPSIFRTFWVTGLVGGVTEYIASWIMETFWGVVAWSYLSSPFNFNGRTDLFHMIVWGVMGVIWTRVFFPFLSQIFSHVHREKKSYKIASKILCVFLCFDIALTVIVMVRADQRSNGLEAQTPIAQLCDVYFPNDVLQDRFANMGGIGIP